MRSTSARSSAFGLVSVNALAKTRGGLGGRLSRGVLLAAVFALVLPLGAEMTPACSGSSASCSESVLQASRADHGPQDFRVADVAVCAAECRLLGR